MTAATEDRYGKHKKFREFADCPRCGYTDFPPGRLSDDQTVEIRVCDDCGSQIETEPYFTAPPGEATTYFES
jgi:transcription elongation factor Elf1